MNRRSITLAVTGGRDYTDQARVLFALDSAWAYLGEFHLVHGAARGADALAARWAVLRGVPQTPVPAQWHIHGKSAGRRRNREMLDRGIDVVLAFPGGRGTEDMVNAAQERGIPVIFA